MYVSCHAFYSKQENPLPLSYPRFHFFCVNFIKNFFGLFSKVSDQFHYGPRLMKNKNDISLRCLNVPTEAPPKSLIIDDVKT